MRKSIRLLYLMEEVRTKGLPEDWKLQRKRGERKRAWSRLSFDKDLYEKRPDINNNSWLKKVYTYTKHNAEVGSDERFLRSGDVIIFLDYIFTEIATPTGWPNTVEIFRSFDDGEFYPLIQGYQENFSKKYIIPKSSLERAGATPGYSATAQLLQLAIQANTESQVMKQNLARTENENEELKKAIEELSREKTEALAKYESLIELLKSKGGDQADIMKELERIKNTINQ